MELKDIIVIVISGLGLIVSAIALIRDFYTRKKVQELTNLEIEKLRTERENKTKATLYGFIEGDFFVIENSGEAAASNVRYKGWSEWGGDTTENLIKFLPAHHKKEIKLYATADSPAEAEFKIMWDDESGKDHEWKETLNIDE